MKKIYLIEKDDNIIIKFELEVMFKKHEIEIELVGDNKRRNNLESNGDNKSSNNLETKDEELIKLREENKDLRSRISLLEKEMKEIKNMITYDFSSYKNRMNNLTLTIKDNEFDLIFEAIKNRLNKEVKGLKKLYQASIDGDSPADFHSRCDNIPNTLVLIQSGENRKFGGFTTAKWSSPSNTGGNDDPYAFLFSIDKQKIYDYKKNGVAIRIYKDWGPCFGSEDISIYEPCYKIRALRTHEKYSKCSFIYNGDKNALSEDGNGSGIYAAEVEVFQVIFS